jgi:hypothetical protein
VSRSNTSTGLSAVHSEIHGGPGSHLFDAVDIPLKRSQAFAAYWWKWLDMVAAMKV